MERPGQQPAALAPALSSLPSSLSLELSPDTERSPQQQRIVPRAKMPPAQLDVVYMDSPREEDLEPNASSSQLSGRFPHGPAGRDWVHACTRVCMSCLINRRRERSTLGFRSWSLISQAAAPVSPCLNPIERYRELTRFPGRDFQRRRRQGRRSKGPFAWRPVLQRCWRARPRASAAPGRAGGGSASWRAAPSGLLVARYTARRTARAEGSSPRQRREQGWRRRRRYATPSACLC